jgi:hypothetical protein
VRVLPTYQLFEFVLIEIKLFQRRVHVRLRVREIIDILWRKQSGAMKMTDLRSTIHDCLMNLLSAQR